MGVVQTKGEGSPSGPLGVGGGETRRGLHHDASMSPRLLSLLHPRSWTYMLLTQTQTIAQHHSTHIYIMILCQGGFPLA